MVTTRAGTSIAPVVVAHDAPSNREPTASAPAAAQPPAGVPEKGRRRSGRLAALGDISNRGIAKRDAAKRGADGGEAKAARRGSAERRSSSASATVPVAAARAAVFVLPLQQTFEVDVENAGDPQHMVPYMREIQACYSRTEMHRRPDAEYMQCAQPHLTCRMRAILIDWLIEVHHKFKLHTETLYSAVGLIDRYLSQASPISRNKLQLVGITAMFIASKYEEIFAPECRDFVFISDSAYERHELLRMEAKMLSTLGFQLTSPSPLVFLMRLVHVTRISGTHAEQLAHYLLELTLPDSAFLKRKPSVLAATATYLALLGTGQPWEDEFGTAVGAQTDEVLACAREMNALQKQGGAFATGYVRKKYAMQKFGAVSGIPPVDL